MTLEEAQKTVDEWIKTYGVRYFSELTNMAVLTEEVGVKSLPSSAQSASVKVALSSIEALPSKRRQLFFMHKYSR